MPRKKPGQFRFKVTIKRMTLSQGNMFVYAMSPDEARMKVLENIDPGILRETHHHDSIACVEKKVRHITGIQDVRGTATVTYPRK